jgi:nucleoside-diphosphate-sugar epimerase
MLKHKNSTPARPNRIVILGAAGFVGEMTLDAFKAEGTEVLPLGRTEIDLLTVAAKTNLAGLLTPTDTLVVISAEAPCKDAAMLIRNVQMMIVICEAISKVQPAHVIYVSSDAVYADSVEPINETSSAEPGSMHGIMHLTRETMLKEAVENTLAILRPTLIYGINDPHNGYGPNRFRRLVEAGENIILFGEGEEQRDHVHISDVAELIRLIAWHKSEGVLNAATGTVTSFKEVAEIIVVQSGASIIIKGSPRVGEMPHNGYRPFDPAATKTAFANFKYITLQQGFKEHFNG